MGVARNRTGAQFGAYQWRDDIRAEGFGVNPAFGQYEQSDVRSLIEDHPLAWVIAPGAPASSAALLPMLGTFDAKGELVALVGHMSRKNALHALLKEHPRAHFLFTGPHGYVSPEHAGRRNWGPTWNYAAVRIEADVHFDEHFTTEAVDRIVNACEAGRAEPWNTGELKERYHGMLRAIIGFKARITAVDATFKMAQDEDEAVLTSLMTTHPDPALRDWMHRFNADRL